MPIQKCSGGVKYGSSGKCYKGKGARSKAVKQMKAIKASQSRRGKK